jgi:plastocyanin
MPFTWRINIKPNPTPGGPAIFEFDQPPQIQVGDQIVWSNDDTLAHFPTPVDQTYAFMANQIAANSTSPAFAPSQQGTIRYHCSLHPSETGTIVVGPAPEQQ